MVQYVNEQTLLDRYAALTGSPCPNPASLLQQAYALGCRGVRQLTLPAAKTLSGREERIPFTFENVGCCGASTIFIRFLTDDD